MNSIFYFDANAEWTLISKTTEGSAFANLKTVRNQHGLKVIQTLFNSTDVSYLENPKEAYKSFYAVQVIDCKANEHASMSIKYFSEKNGQGAVVAEHEDKELLHAEFIAIRANKPLAKLRDLVCKKN